MPEFDATPPRAARFWNRIARKYARDPVANQAAYEYKLERTASYLTPEMSVLEIGCGTGTTALIHAPRVRTVLATDFSAEMIRIARERAANTDVRNIRFEISSIEALPKPDAAYDVIMAHSFLHLVDDIDAVLSKVHGLLKPGGLFVSSTVCIRDMSRFLPLVLPLLGRTGLIPRVSMMRGQEVSDKITSAGFKIIETWRPDEKGSIFIVAQAN